MECGGTEITTLKLGVTLRHLSPAKGQPLLPSRQTGHHCHLEDPFSFPSPSPHPFTLLSLPSLRPSFSGAVPSHMHQELPVLSVKYTPDFKDGEDDKRRVK